MTYAFQTIIFGIKGLEMDTYKPPKRMRSYHTHGVSNCWLLLKKYIEKHSTESNSDSGHGTVEQNWYTFRQSQISMFYAPFNVHISKINNNFMEGEWQEVPKKNSRHHHQKKGCGRFPGFFFVKWKFFSSYIFLKEFLNNFFP